jgi:hypothetical protein
MHTISTRGFPVVEIVSTLREDTMSYASETSYEQVDSKVSPP